MEVIGRLDALFANAEDTGALHPLAESLEDAFGQVVAVNLRGLRHMNHQRGGWPRRRRSLRS